MLKRLLVAGLLLACGDSGAAILVIFDHVDHTNNDWVYNVRLQPSSYMSVGDTFTVYDFPGLQGASFDPGPAVAGRTFTPSMLGTGITPDGVDPPDNPLLTNVTITMTGGAVIGATATTVTQLGQITLTGLSDVKSDELIYFSAVATQKAGNSVLANNGPLPAPVPEPATMGFLGAGLCAAAALAFRRRKRSI